MMGEDGLDLLVKACHNNRETDALGQMCRLACGPSGERLHHDLSVSPDFAVSTGTSFALKNYCL